MEIQYPKADRREISISRGNILNKTFSIRHHPKAVLLFDRDPEPPQCFHSPDLPDSTPPTPTE